MNAQIFENQAALFLKDYGDQFLPKIPRHQPGVLCIYPLPNSSQHITRWMTTQNIEAAITAGNDPMREFLPGFLQLPVQANFQREVVMAILSNDFRFCSILALTLPRKKRIFKRFRRAWQRQTSKKIHT